MVSDTQDSRSASHHVSFWMPHARTLRLNLHFGIRFSQIRSRNPNEIIFGLNDGYYAADFDQKVRPALHFSGVSASCSVLIVWYLLRFYFLSIRLWLLQDQSELKKNSLLQVDQSSVRNSYSVFSLLR